MTLSMQIIQYLKMPPALEVLGVCLALIALPYLVSYIRDGFWLGMAINIKNVICSRVYVFIMFILADLFIISFVDKPVSQLCKTYYNVNFYTAVDFICSMGEGWFVGGVLFSLILIFEFYKQPLRATVCKIALMASIYAGLFNGVIKFIFNRQRPSIGLQPWNFFHFFLSGAKHYSDLLYAYNSMSSKQFYTR
jgi:hypothetical protein